MEDLSFLIEVLELTVKRHGDIPITSKHLLNIVKLAKSYKDKAQDEYENILQNAVIECLNPNS